MLSSSLALRSALRLRSSAFTPAIRSFRTSLPSAGAALVSPAKPKQPSPNASLEFKLERLVFVGSLPVLPLAYFVHTPAVDWLLSAAIVANAYFGGHAILTDYGREYVFGPAVAKVIQKLYIVGAAVLAIVLSYFNIYDVGLTRAFEIVFSL